MVKKNVVVPEKVQAKLELPNKTVNVESDAVKNEGQQISVGKIVEALKKAAKRNLFPPITELQNG